MKCEHDLTEREVAVADGMCPLCLAVELNETARRLEEALKREASWKIEIQDRHERAEELQKRLDDPSTVRVPVEPTPEMLMAAGTIAGYDSERETADADHISWWKAMLAAAKKD